MLADNGKLLLTRPSKLCCESSNRSDDLAVMRPAADRDAALCTGRSDCLQSCLTWSSREAECLLWCQGVRLTAVDVQQLCNSTDACSSAGFSLLNQATSTLRSPHCSIMLRLTHVGVQHNLPELAAMYMCSLVHRALCCRVWHHMSECKVGKQHRESNIPLRQNHSCQIAASAVSSSRQQWSK